MKTLLPIAILCFLSASALSQPATFNVTFDAVVSPVQDGVTIEGRTNLPNGSVIALSMGGGGLIWERRSTVQNSNFKFGPLPASPGNTYGVNVGLAAMELQPAAVRRLLGNSGELMRGRTVKTIEGTSLVIQGVQLQLTR